MRKIIAIGLLLIPCVGVADFTVEMPLSFGEIAVRSNLLPSSVSVYRNGAYSSANQIFIIKPGSPAVLSLTNMPAYRTVSLSVDLPTKSITAFPNSAQFTLTAIDLPETINTGPSGNVQFKMGGTLSTSGNPDENYYSGAQYEILINLNLDY